jgi:O-antigen/teichoic acid export membrane protein
MVNWLGKILNTTDARSKQLRANVVFSMVLKVIGLVTSLLLVPITLDYLNSEVYGIWLTISSILYWFAFFDVGLSNGMRNYLAQAVANGDYNTGQSYVSTTLIILSAIAVGIGLLSVLPLGVFDFQTVFNTTLLASIQLRNVMVVAVLFTLALFVVRTFGIIYVALQKYAVNDAINVCGHLLALIIIYVLTKTTCGNLMYVVLALTATPVAVYLLAAIPLFRKYPQLRPSFNSYDSSAVRDVVGKGLGFFAIQMTSCLIIFGGSNIIITQYCGPESVTVYNIAYKYFNVLTIGYTILLAPMWSAYTEAYAKGDMAWISKTFHRALIAFGLQTAGGVVMLAASPIVYHLWIGDSVHIPFTVSLSVTLYVLAFNFNNCVTYLLNGLNTIYVQIITSIVFTVIYTGVVLAMGGTLAVEGIVACMAVSYCAMGMIHLYQCRLLISGKATGIWKR